MGAVRQITQTTFEIEDEFFDNFTSVHTRENYRSDLAQFFLYIETHFPKIKKFDAIERRMILKFRLFVEELGGVNGGAGAPKTIARKLSAVSSYFDFLAERNLILFNPVNSVKRPRKEVKSPTNALNADQVRELLAAINETSLSGKMHKALLMTFFFTGLRKNEILLLKIKNFKDMGEYRILEYAGKGGKLGQKVLHPKAAEAITEYLMRLKEKTGEQHFEDWLFRPSKNPADPSNTNKPLNPKTINEILDNYALKIGLPFKVVPHSARATFISELLEQGVDIYKVALEVNHSSVKTTQEYDKRRQKLQDHLTLKLNY